jgi:hypothetical protein
MEIKIMGKEINEISSASARVELKRLIVGLAITLIVYVCCRLASKAGIDDVPTAFLTLTGVAVTLLSVI